MGLEELRALAQRDPTVANLRALAVAIAERLREMHTEAGDAALSEERNVEWLALDAEHGEVTARIEQRQREDRVAESRAKWGGLTVGSKVDVYDGRDVRSLGPAEVRSKAQKHAETDSGYKHLRDDQRERLDTLIRSSNQNTNGAHIAQRALLTGHPDYRTGFMKLSTEPQPILTGDEAKAVRAFREWRAMSIGTDAAGGFGVPVEIDPTIMLTGQGSPNPVLDLCDIITITNDQWLGVSSAGMTWKYRAEAATTTDGSPTLAQPSVATHRADGVITFSIEVEGDYPSFAAEMSKLLDSGYLELLSSKLTTGTGSTQPYGIVTALDANTNVEVSLTTAATLSARDLNNFWAQLPIRYRTGSGQVAWMCSTDVNGHIQELGTAVGNAFTVDFTAEGVAILKGRQVRDNDYMASLPSTTAAANLLVVGDWSNYKFVQRAGMNVELVQHMLDVTTNMPTGERAWFAWARNGADSINDLGFRLLQNKTS